MGILLGIFLFGCFVAAIVALGLVFAMGALSPAGMGAFEGRSARDERAPDQERPENRIA